MKPASFSLKKYSFNKIEIDLNNNTSNNVNISFKPSGIFNQETSDFELKILFISYNKESENPFIKIECIANYKFNNVTTSAEIPQYFYTNSIAIIFPYIRAFVSNITLQANINPLILPTMNLSSLEKELKINTTFV